VHKQEAERAAKFRHQKLHDAAGARHAESDSIIPWQCMSRGMQMHDGQPAKRQMLVPQTHLRIGIL
jgi:hypothetical protein